MVFKGLLKKRPDKQTRKEEVKKKKWELRKLRGRAPQAAWSIKWQGLGRKCALNLPLCLAEAPVIAEGSS